MSSTTLHEPQRTTTPLALAATIAGGTLAYADPVRFDNDGTFVWSAGVFVDLTKPPEEQSGSPGTAATFEYREVAGRQLLLVSGSSTTDQVIHYDLNTIAVVGALGDLVPDDFLAPRHDWVKAATLGYYYSGGFYTQFDKSLISGVPGDPGYLAARFTIDGATHYGWMSLHLIGYVGGPPSRKFELLAWGYETEPNTPIEAGAVPAPSGALALLAFGAAAGATRVRRKA